MFNNFSTDDFNNVAFLAPTPADRDYDLNFDGWVGDYQDPSTYLNPFNAEGMSSTSRFLVLYQKIKLKLLVWS